MSILAMEMKLFIPANNLHIKSFSFWTALREQTTIYIIINKEINFIHQFALTFIKDCTAFYNNMENFLRNFKWCCLLKEIVYLTNKMYQHFFKINISVRVCLRRWESEFTDIDVLFELKVWNYSVLFVFIL